MLVCALALSSCGGAYQLHGLGFQPPNPAPGFALTAHVGQPFRLSEQRGKVVLLFF